MPIVSYKNLTDHLSAAKPDSWPAVTLICGEELLCKKAYRLVLDALLPEENQAMGVEVVDGNETGVDAALTSMNTYALLSGTKVVVLRDARFFYSSGAQQGLREKMTQAGQDGALKRASRPFLHLMALLGVAFEDLSTASLREKVTEDVDGAPAPWFAQLIDYCQEKKLTIPESTNDADLLLAAMKKGFPAGHRLILTADVVDRRKALFKSLKETSLVVDCAVPKGESRADRMAQEAVSNATIDEMLSKAGKQLPAEGRRRLLEWTGFDLRTLSANLEKLISYAGERETITDADVSRVLQRTRKDPIFEFTNTVGDRDLSGALFSMKSLLEEGMHPLQLLSAVANQVRRLLVAKDFILRDRGRTWSGKLPFPQFKTGPFTAIQTDDGEFLSQLSAAEPASSASAKGKTKQPASDLVLAKNPRSSYPVFQTLKKADKVSQRELVCAMIDLSEIDLKMKSSGQDPALLLEGFLLRFCRKGDHGIS